MSTGRSTRQRIPANPITPTGRRDAKSIGPSPVGSVGGPAPRRIGASPTAAILSWMQGRTVTQGWDVVCAIAYDKINEWFLQQYVERLRGGEDPVINGSVPQAGGISIQAVNLTLGPPLISFSPTFPPNYVGLTVNFLSGQVNVVQTNGQATTVLSTQVVTPGDEYALTGLVPLASVQGEVEASHDVVIDVVNGESFAANLNMPEGAQTLLGQFIRTWMAEHLKGYQYHLGTLIYADNGTNLVPAGTFQFATQIDATDHNDTGRLLLFIPTTYNPGGGTQTSLGLADVVPQGCSTALIISSRVLFQNILKSFYETTFSKWGVQATASQQTPVDPYTLTLTAGGVNIGEQWWPQNQSWQQGRVFSGKDSLGTGPDQEPVVIPVSNTQLQVSSDQLLISGRSQWQQDLAIVWPLVKTEGIHKWGSITMTAVVNCPTTASVTAVKDTVSLKGAPQVTVSYDAHNIANSSYSDMWNDLAGQISTAAQAGLAEFFNVPLPEVNAFAVSNLLFPGENILDFQSVYLPGDMVIFGDVATPGVVVTPGSATLGPARSQQFSATSRSGEAVQWSAEVGTISASGLYTAPSAVGQVQIDTVKATDAKSDVAAAALVTLVPQGAQVSPAFVLMQPTTPPQQFSAALSGAANQDVTWSMAPQVGTLSAQGLYTPPASVASPQAVTITATSPSDPSIQGTALVALFASSPTLVAVTPPQTPAPLTPGGTTRTQQFKATVPGMADQSVNWSLLPPVGRITPNGLYIAPNTITAPQSVLVVATSTLTSVLFGTGLVMLSPGD